MTESYIKTGVGGTMFAGPDATQLFRAVVVKHGLKMAKAGIRATRGFTITRGLQMVTGYTGKKYKRTEVDRALRDLEIWIATMRAALPVIEEKKS